MRSNRKHKAKPGGRFHRSWLGRVRLGVVRILHAIHEVELGSIRSRFSEIQDQDTRAVLMVKDKLKKEEDKLLSKLKTFNK